jgi:membrane-bound lytic murein transglycosylase F
MVIGLLPFVCWSGSLFPDDYDREFKDAAIFLPVGTDWRLLKAQCYQESRLKPYAVSPVGAMGLCQFMPGTWGEVSAQLDGLTSPWLPEQSIRAAAYYMQRLNRGWSSERPQSDRYLLALASYNAGFGNLLQAQRKCGMPVLYSEIIPCLEQVTGKHSAETRGYVKNIIGRWYPAMLIGG